MLFRKNMHLTGTERTIKFLNMGYKVCTRSVVPDRVHEVLYFSG